MIKMFCDECGRELRQERCVTLIESHDDDFGLSTEPVTDRHFCGWEHMFLWIMKQGIKYGWVKRAIEEARRQTQT